MNTNRTLAIIFVALAAIATLPMISGMGLMGSGMMGPGMTDRSSDAWGLAMGLTVIATVAFWASVVVAVVLLVRAVVGHAPSGTPGREIDEPLGILRRRYAAGEIDQPTYERMKHELTA
jgi:uncharacterized membrane protein